ncbi:MAG: hypothetical protein BroJett033_6310 [Chloroflexota bacterium]|nr:MAG: hypothetical protein BroJett033_6310 [Chloroflexota bacterium]
MTPEQREAYLSAALDQEACKPTLTEALISRVVALRADGAAPLSLIEALENLYEEPDQLNRDVIEAVLEWILAAMAGGQW